MNEDMRKQISDALENELSGLRVSPFRMETLFRKAKGETKVKKKMKWVPVTAIILTVLLAGAALAASTGAFDELTAMWNDSFDRMNTSGALDVVDEPDVPAYLDAFEEEYGGKKEDLIIFTVPGEGELSLDEAKQTARNAIMEKFGTPAEELDAMGVYPEFLRTPYTDDPPEWDFCFTPRTGMDIDECSGYAAPGDYRVYINAVTGEVTYCGWYMDDFWPEYALRTWNAGKKDYVFEQAMKPDFVTQNPEDRDAFIALFEAEGYDVSALERMKEDLFGMMQTKMNFMDPAESILNSDDEFVIIALKETEERFGFTKADLNNCCYTAAYSIYPSDTVDICLGYNYELAGGSRGECESAGLGYAHRFGFIVIGIDPETMTAVSGLCIPDSVFDEGAEDPSLLLGRFSWTCEDLPEFCAMTEELKALDEQYRTCQITQSAMMNERDRVMLKYGGNPSYYTADRDEKDDALTFAQWLYLNEMTEEQIRNAGIEAISARSGRTAEHLGDAYFIAGTNYDDPEDPYMDKMHPTLLVILDNGNARVEWYIQFDMDLNVTEFTETEGVPGANG